MRALLFVAALGAVGYYVYTTYLSRHPSEVVFRAVADGLVMGERAAVKAAADQEIWPRLIEFIDRMAEPDGLRYFGIVRLQSDEGFGVFEDVTYSAVTRTPGASADELTIEGLQRNTRKARSSERTFKLDLKHTMELKRIDGAWKVMKWSVAEG